MHQADFELARLGIGKERAMVGVGVHAHAQNAAVPAQRHLALEVDVAAESGGDEVPALVLDPLDGAFEQDRSPDRHHVARIHRHLVPETAAEVGRDDADHVLGQLGHHCHCGPDDVRRLGSHVHGELRGRPVEVGDRTAGLDGRRVRARVVHLDGRDHVGLGEGPIGALPVADLPIEHHVVVLAGLVVADQRRIGGQRLGRVDDGRQRFVVDDDGLAAVLREVGVVGDDARDLLPLESDLVGGEDRLGVIRHVGIMPDSVQQACRP